MNASMQLRGWVPQIEGVEGPIYLAIADAIGTAVARGELRAGERLPTHRALAEALGVDLTTITRAYAEARRRGLLQATVGRGTFVRAGSPATPKGEAEPERVVDLGMNLPPQPAGVDLQDVIGRDMAALLARWTRLTSSPIVRAPGPRRSARLVPPGFVRPSARWIRSGSSSPQAPSPRSWLPWARSPSAAMWS